MKIPQVYFYQIQDLSGQQFTFWSFTQYNDNDLNRITKLVSRKNNWINELQGFGINEMDYTARAHQ